MRAVAHQGGTSGAGIGARGLLFAARRLLAGALTPPPERSPSRWIDSYLSAARQARSLMAEHARLCESDGLIASLGEGAPVMPPGVSRWLDDHGAILDGLDALIERARGARGGGSGAIADLSYDTLLCEGRMSAHLHRAFDLVVEATHRDLGGEGG